MRQRLERLARAFFRPVAFVSKEFVQVVRQPQLILTLIVAPFLVLLLFGVGYTGADPPLRTVLVLPADAGLPMDVETYRDEFVAQFELVEVTSDREGAVQRVNDREIDVAVVFPEDASELIGSGQQATIELFYNELAPWQRGWLRFYSRAQTDEINRRVLIEAVRNARQESDLLSLRTYSGETDPLRQQLNEQVAAGNYGDARETVAEMRGATQNTAASALQLTGLLVGVSLGWAGGENPVPSERVEQFQSANQQLSDIDDTLASLDRSLQTPEDSETIQSDLDRLTEQQQGYAAFSAGLPEFPPEVLVSPFASDETNLAPTSPSFVAYYAPGVLALLVQHIAVTLTALALVRERLRGAVELFRIAPVSAGEILAGKYLSYLAQSAVLVAILVGTMFVALDIPMLGEYWQLVLMLALVVAASLGLGLAISATARTETQAVQLAMLVLLASVFFSGFFLPVETLVPWVRAVSYALPVTYGIEGLQLVMLRGERPPVWLLGALAAMAVLLTVLASFLFQRQFRRT
jgi:ABC-2 type transport system permease protein